MAALAVAMLVLTLAPGGATAATTRNCGVYTVQLPQHPGSAAGADPAEQQAVNCSLGYHEHTGYPLSLIVVAILATLVVGVLLNREQASIDPRESGLDASGANFDLGSEA